MWERTAADPGSVSLGTILDHLDSLLTYRAGPAARHRPVRAVGLFDPLDDRPLDPGTLVLGIGIGPSSVVPGLFARLLESGAAALAVRDPGPVDSELVAAAEASGVALVGVAAGASWPHLLSLVTELINSSEATSMARSDGLDLDDGDLFSVSNSLAALLEAPVTIEGTASQILAFSTNQLDTDEARRETILGRQVPERFLRQMREIGFMQRLRDTRRPLFLPSLGPGVHPRIAMPVRAGGVFLGSIWTIAEGEPTDRYEQRMVEAANIVALRMLRAHELASIAAHRRSRQMSALLDGGPAARHAAEQAGMPNRLTGLLAVGLRPADTPDSDADSHLMRIGGALGIHVAAVHPRGCAAVIGRTVFAVVPLSGDDPTRATARLGEIGADFAASLGGSLPVLVAIGGVVNDVARLAPTRRDAEMVLRVLDDVVDRGHPPVASAPEVQSLLLLRELADRIAADGTVLAGPLADLVAHDRRHKSDLVRSLRAWFDAFGDVGVAAAAIDVHPNTLRYRLRRATQITGLALGDPDVRLGTMLQLRLFATPAG